MLDVDILSIDAEIVSRFKTERKKIPQYEEMVIEMKKSLTIPNLSDRVKKTLRKDLEVLRDKIEDIKTERT